jgi:hypothetical protein
VPSQTSVLQVTCSREIFVQLGMSAGPTPPPSTHDCTLYTFPFALFLNVLPFFVIFLYIFGRLYFVAMGDAMQVDGPSTAGVKRKANDDPEGPRPARRIRVSIQRTRHSERI